MIAEGAVRAEKIGSAWAVPEGEVAARLDTRPKAGRPAKKDGEPRQNPCIDLHDLYVELKDGNFARPSASTLAMMQDKEEAGFVLCVCDYFLGLRQREEIAEGVY